MRGIKRVRSWFTLSIIWFEQQRWNWNNRSRKKIPKALRDTKKFNYDENFKKFRRKHIFKKMKEEPYGNVAKLNSRKNTHNIRKVFSPGKLLQSEAYVYTVSRRMVNKWRQYVRVIPPMLGRMPSTNKGLREIQVV